jgi:uracil-DNA glycosylase
LCFSVADGVAPPPSLVNIFKEINHEYPECRLGGSGNLTGWAQQGVLLLNTALTVRAGSANSHQGQGWEFFTDSVICALNEREKPVVFLLWGANAKSKKSLVTNPHHLVLTAAHPSPLSAYNGFFHCGHFKKANDFLGEFTSPVDWCDLTIKPQAN